jgi:hypothetical protein
VRNTAKAACRLPPCGFQLLHAVADLAVIYLDIQTEAGTGHALLL